MCCRCRSFYTVLTIVDHISLPRNRCYIREEKVSRRQYCVRTSSLIISVSLSYFQPFLLFAHSRHGKLPRSLFCLVFLPILWNIVPQFGACIWYKGGVVFVFGKVYVCGILERVKVAKLSMSYNRC